MWKLMSMLAICCVGALALPPQHMSRDDSLISDVDKFENGLELIDEAFYAALDHKENAPRASNNKVQAVQFKPEVQKGLSSGSYLSSSDRLTKIRLKKKCKEVYGDDFDVKWDCIRSGTFPPAVVVIKSTTALPRASSPDPSTASALPVTTVASTSSAAVITTTQAPTTTTPLAPTTIPPTTIATTTPTTTLSTTHAPTQTGLG